MFDDDEITFTEEDIDNLCNESDAILKHPELVNTSQQLVELVHLNLRALKMDDPEEYPPYLIIAAFLTKIGGSFNIEPMEILEGLKHQIDEWRNE